MTLKELIERLRKEPRSKVVAHGFDSFHSWRGDYSSVAFRPCEETTVGQMLAVVMEADGAVIEGYKGGERRISLYTECYLTTGPAEWNGEDDIFTSRDLDAMLRGANE